MIVVRISEETCNNGEIHLFPDEICHDPAILFHGTSDRNSELIESQGLLPLKFPINQIKDTVALFEKLEWKGINGHFATLVHYGHDAAARPIYLTEDCKHALGYAHNESEMDRSFRGCIMELEEFLENSTLREEVLSRMQKKNLFSNVIGLQVKREFDLDEVRLRFEQLKKSI